MPYLQETIIGLVLIAIILYYLYKIPKNKEEKLRLLTKYRRIKNESLKVVDNLSNYILANDAFNEVYFNNDTFGDLLKKLQHDHSEFLSEELYLKIRNGNNRRLMKKTLVNLDRQKMKLDEIKKQLNSTKIKALT